MSDLKTINASCRPIPRVLSIAGSDSGGGAGIQADLKAISAGGGYGMTAITALTAQNTRGVQSVFIPPVDFLNQQLESISTDIAVDAVKIGMLATTEIIECVESWLQKYAPPIVVLDPVMVASSGDRLLDAESVQALKKLFPLVTLITPNTLELAALLGQQPAPSFAVAVEQARELSRQHGVRVLVKGGHLESVWAEDALVVPEAEQALWHMSSPRVETNNTHGTGCSFSSMVATRLAQTGDFVRALSDSKQWLQGAIAGAHELEVGQGNGPVHHFYRLHKANLLAAEAKSSELESLRHSFARTVYEQSRQIREATNNCDFVQQLGAGSLSLESFIYYLDQDALYLREYSRALAMVSYKAPTVQSRLFFAKSSVGAVEEEAAMHSRWTARYADSPCVSGVAGSATQMYTDFLLAQAGESYAVGAAAVLPCYWLYADIGQLLHEQYLARSESHPYAEWLATYGADNFQELTQAAIKYVDEAAKEATDQELIAMKNTFLRACWLEYEFFEAPLHRAPLA